MPAVTQAPPLQETNADDTRPPGWPCVFYVCTFHKETCFADYDQAIPDDSKPCVICEPCENDSLGG
jgi:hypothetical protein